jgi:hypothetical protein
MLFHSASENCTVRKALKHINNEVGLNQYISSNSLGKIYPLAKCSSACHFEKQKGVKKHDVILTYS